MSREGFYFTDFLKDTISEGENMMLQAVHSTTLSDV
jgi:hypothetical protein